MKKNGFTTIELVICFVIISVISTSIFGVVLSFRERQQIESIRSEVLAYKYSLTKIVQDDIIKKGVKNAFINISGGLTIEYFNPETIDESDIIRKTIFVNSENDDISIGYRNLNEYSESVIYKLPNINDLRIDHEKLYFSVDQVGTSNTYFVTVYIPFTHPDLEDEHYSINIVFPFTRS